jgi:hypothetical protein
VIALGLRGSQILGALNAPRAIKRFGEWGWLRIAPLVIYIGVVALGAFNSILGIAVFALTGFAGAITAPLMETIILRQTPGAVRATILSVDSLLHRLMLAMIGPVIGLVADGFGLPTAFIGVGVGFGLIMFLLLVGWNRIAEPAGNSVPA